MPGWFDFINGQTLPASRVQEFLMDQSVMKFADSGSRAAALPFPTDGMVSYLTDIDRLFVYRSSSSAWVQIAESTNLAALSAVLPTRQNAIINGGFDVWQRGTSITPTSGYAYTADRWRTFSYGASTSTFSQQAFTPGTAPVAGYEGRFFARVLSTNSNAVFSHIIEDVRTFAGQQVTLSFWAKSATAQTLTNVYISQSFGAGGSAAVDTVVAAPTITTSWTRYTFTLTLPSVAGKTITSNSLLDLNIWGNVNNALDIWGVQLEAGSVATPFVRAATTLQGELAACQRYYQRYTSVANNAIFTGTMFSSTIFYGAFVFPKMRVAPSSSVSAAAAFTIFGAGTSAVSTAAGLNTLSDVSAEVQISIGAPITAGSGAWARWAGTTGFYFFELSAEL
jgi:hypothetical protein